MMVFWFWIHSGVYTMQDLSYLGKIALVLIWFKMVYLIHPFVISNFHSPHSPLTLAGRC
jgi:hypothetical protein